MTLDKLGPTAPLAAHIRHHPLFSSVQYKGAFSGASKTQWMLVMGNVFSPKTIHAL